jgi:hypothetical protein
VAEKLHAAGKIKDMCEDADFYRRLTALEAQYPNASVLVHKQGVLPPGISDLWGSKKLMGAARQLLGGAKPHFYLTEERSDGRITRPRPTQLLDRACAGIYMLHGKCMGCFGGTWNGGNCARIGKPQHKVFTRLSNCASGLWTRNVYLVSSSLREKCRHGQLEVLTLACPISWWEGVFAFGYPSRQSRTKSKTGFWANTTSMASPLGLEAQFTSATTHCIHCRVRGTRWNTLSPHISASSFLLCFIAHKV